MSQIKGYGARDGITEKDRGKRQSRERDREERKLILAQEGAAVQPVPCLWGHPRSRSTESLKSQDFPK